MANAARKAETNFVEVAQKQLVAAEPQFRSLAIRARSKVDFGQEMRFALSAISNSEQLKNCSPESFREAFENLGAMGLSLNPTLGQAALIPRWNAKQKKTLAVAMPMYRGYIALATAGKSIKNVWGDVVLEGDEFSVEKGSNPKITHMMKPRKRGDGVPSPDNVVAAYVVAEVVGSAHPHITVMWLDDILAVAQRSESYNPKPRDEYVDGQKTGKKYTPKPSGPWLSDFGQMCIKTAFRRGAKTWPGMSEDEYIGLQEAVRIDTEAEIAEQHLPESQAETVKTPEGGVLTLNEEQAQKLTEAAKNAGIRAERVAGAYGVREIRHIAASEFDAAMQRMKDVAAKRTA